MFVTVIGEIERKRCGNLALAHALMIVVLTKTEIACDRTWLIWSELICTTDTTENMSFYLAVGDGVTYIICPPKDAHHRQDRICDDFVIYMSADSKEAY